MFNEILETRRLFSVVCALDPRDGILTISGDDRADHVDVLIQNGSTSSRPDPTLARPDPTAARVDSLSSKPLEDRPVVRVLANGRQVYSNAKAGAWIRVVELDLGGGDNVVSLTNSGTNVQTSITTGAGSDTVWARSTTAPGAFVQTGAGKDRITYEVAGGRTGMVDAGADADLIDASSGAATYARGWGTTLLGGAGDDWIRAFAKPGSTGFYIEGGSGSDDIYGSDASDMIYGDDAFSDPRPDGKRDIVTLQSVTTDLVNDLLVREESNDRIFAGGGDDCIWGGAGADLIDGGDGDDMAFADAFDRLINVETQTRV